MYCNNCGAAVTGNYCSVCGQKIRTPLAEFRLQERRRKNKFIAEMVERPNDFVRHHIAEACWTAGALKYIRPEGRLVGEIRSDAYGGLDKAEDLARQLYLRLSDLLESTEN